MKKHEFIKLPDLVDLFDTHERLFAECDDMLDKTERFKAFVHFFNSVNCWWLRESGEVVEVD